ncbi:MAG: FGGY-family carbohydrate kinase [Candidatus Omnitrophica bacterium]|nr:FGGY-family carbohydrate kinase [Candidatus Omnitrophota bacterium]
MTKKFLCFDSGTTNTKVFLFSQKGRLVQKVSVETQITFPAPLFAEQNSENWVIALTKGILRLNQSQAVSCISGSFQGGTFVLLDKNLQPLRPAMTWLDNRAKDIASDLIKEHGEDFFYKKTGYVPGGWSCIAMLKWLKKNEPETFKKIARISFVADYVNHFLTGNFIMDYTNAAITTLFNIVKCQWDEDLLELAGIKKQMLPEITQASSFIGTLKQDAARLTGLKSGIPVVAGGHDQYCASLGAGAGEKGSALVSCGTAWVLLVTTGKLVFDSERQLSPGPHLKPGTYGIMAAMSNGGVIYAWGRKNLVGKSFLFKEPSNVVVIPEFNTGRGLISGLNLSTTSSEILQGIVESLCFQVREKLEKVNRILPKKEKINRVIMIGGAAKDMVVARMLATITGKTVFVPKIVDATGFGAMRLSISASGLEKLPGRVVKPRYSLIDSYMKSYNKFMQLKNICKEL